MELTPVPAGSALVTGASRGIGAAVAKQLAAAGWPVVVDYRADGEGAERVVGEIEDAGGRAIAVQADVADPGAPDTLYTRAEATFGPVLVLVNNAGLYDDALTPAMGDDAWDRVIQTNLTGAFRMTRRGLGRMIRARFGRVVNIASVAGHRANAGQSNYAASKAGLVAFTKTVAVEVARKGVTVNAVSPGLIETELTAAVAARLTSAIPAGRPGTAEEVAACVAFLASPQAAYVTGAVLTVDGGMSA